MDMKRHLLPHERNGCTHNWINYAGMQCEISAECRFDKKGDSNEVAFIYLCTICQEKLWSTDKMFDIPHYRVRVGDN